MNTTTRRHPRTLAEAFPSGTEYANAIEVYKASDINGITIVLVVGVVLALAIVGRWIGGLL